MHPCGTNQPQERVGKGDYRGANAPREFAQKVEAGGTVWLSNSCFRHILKALHYVVYLYLLQLEEGKELKKVRLIVYKLRYIKLSSCIYCTHLDATVLLHFRMKLEGAV